MPEEGENKQTTVQYNANKNATTKIAYTRKRNILYDVVY